MGVLSPVYGGLGVLQRIENTAEARRKWEFDMSMQLNANVTISDAGLNASAGEPYIWVISAGFSSTSTAVASVGRDVTSNPTFREVVAGIVADIENGRLSTVSASIGIPAFEHEVHMTPMLVFQATGTTGVSLVTTVFKNDVTRLVVVSGVLGAFFADGLGNSTGAVVSIKDHKGSVFARGGCDLRGSGSRIGGSVPVTTNATWSVTVGQCPTYATRFYTWKRWVFLAVIVFATLLAMDVYRRNVRKTQFENWQHALVAQQQVYRMIVGYVCHEVRTPLHVLRSSFDALVSLHGASLARVGELERQVPVAEVTQKPTTAECEDRACGSIRRTRSFATSEGQPSNESEYVIADGDNALKQMQASPTVTSLELPVVVD
jgi:hypothetical protein